MLNGSDAATERWNHLIDEFRAFGGTANNVVQRQGPLGLGLFPIDPSQPIELHAPGHLLVPTDNLELRDGEVRLKNEQSFPKGFGDWYRRFQSEYSWGAEAKTSIIRFESELRKLPVAIRQILDHYLPVTISKRLQGIDENQEAFRRFILTRQIDWKGENVLMPVIELVNHSPLVESWGISNEGIKVQGRFDNEILVRYSVADPMHRFLQYGFVCEEQMGFSMSLKLMHREYAVLVNGGINFKPFSKPSVLLKDNTIVINSPLLGSDNRPRMPRTLLFEACKHIKGVNTDELFDQIYFKNRIELIALLQELENIDFKDGLKNQLQLSCYLQMNAIGEHYGCVNESG